MPSVNTNIQMYDDANHSIVYLTTIHARLLDNNACKIFFTMTDKQANMQKLVTVDNLFAAYTIGKAEIQKLMQDIKQFTTAIRSKKEGN